MRILIATAGSRGDVVPYTGLGVRLRAAGHRVAIATHDRLAGLVTGPGLEFRPLSGDPHALLASGAGRRLQRAGPGVRGVPDFLRLGAGFVRSLGPDLARAAVDADLLLLTPVTAPLGYSVAQSRGIPSLGVFLQPVAPTAEFPPVVLGAPGLTRWGNRAAGALGERLGQLVYADASRRLRAELGLPPASVGRLQRAATAGGWPVLHGFSPTVVPRPPDWRPGLDVAGYWWPPPLPDWRPPAELAAFLAAGPPPVYVGFGSMVGHADLLGGLIAPALRRAGLRAVVQRGWAGLDPRPAGRDDILTVGEVPHEWLFPRMAALVHHAGGGTTAAGLRAGTPAVPVPMLGDQPFWAARLVRSGVSPGVLPARRLGVPRLAAALVAATGDPAYARRARSVAARLAGEDGVEPVLRAIDRLG
ncbi:glycosyltransferase [Plantactinospora siamensis]|uniref:Glycosyltransferase n=1 Tax=Plantactinospora siamensis TaxID=555372 RepID=A0ABV6P2M2_9ACTN